MVRDIAEVADCARPLYLLLYPVNIHQPYMPGRYTSHVIFSIMAKCCLGTTAKWNGILVKRTSVMVPWILKESWYLCVSWHG